MSSFTNINLNTVWVIALLLLVIIILSGVKICDKKSINSENKEQTISRFLDTDYNYISEPFEVTPVVDPILKQFSDLSQKRIEKTMQKTLNQERKNLQINNLKNQIDELENKILVLKEVI